ncbi:MAG: glycoside hydrolase family 127 protein [Gorillibacterium sp.]|nr:glycoside hydrolase family 127 protein [Gorillibacterium sp.]
MYLYTAMADMVNTTGDPTYVDALNRVWQHTTERNMYLTGGIGPSKGSSVRVTLICVYFTPLKQLYGLSSVGKKKANPVSNRVT